MKKLVISFEDNRWGVIRLIRALHERGVAVAALCPPGHATTQTKFLSRHFELDDVKSRCEIELALATAMHEWRPSLVIPGDERAVAFLHAFLRRAKSGEPTQLDAEALAVLFRSIGDDRHHNKLLMKNETLALARELGLRAPEGGSVSSLGEAVALAERIGFPVYLKKPFSWAGQGVVRCNGPNELASAFRSMRPPRKNAASDYARRLLGRDWYPTNTTVDLQAAIDGTPALYCLAAWWGVKLAGYSGGKVQTTHENGPSSVIHLAAHEDMARTASEMVAATGATGFMAFDFMIERDTGHAYLIECNPRPVPCSHLGSRIGVDLPQALIDAVRGDVRQRPPAAHSETVALFPQEWRRSPEALAAFDGFVDVPENDAALLARMMMEPLSDAAGERQLRLTSALTAATSAIWQKASPTMMKMPKQVYGLLGKSI